MSFGRHGQIGSNIYVLMLVTAAVMPATRIFSEHGIVLFIGVIALVAVSAWINAKTIIRRGGSTKGEILGLISGVLVWLTVWGTPNIWILVKGDLVFVDVVSLTGVSVVSILCAVAWHQFVGKT